MRIEFQISLKCWGQKKGAQNICNDHVLAVKNSRRGVFFFFSFLFSSRFQYIGSFPQKGHGFFFPIFFNTVEV